MEFCPGGDLYAAIKKGHMSPSEVECCFKQILTGVTYLHSQGVAHRDIKPENLFFDTQGHLKVWKIIALLENYCLLDLRLVITALQRSIDYLGNQVFICQQAFAAANHI
jgi:serine/threonine protein kinase